MPNVVMGDKWLNKTSTPIDRVYDYTYPDGLDLRPGTILHDRIRDKIMLRAYDSSRRMTIRHGAWNEIDRTLTAYISADDAEREVKGKDYRKPISIVFPYSYTVLETLLSYYVGAFLQDPIFRYEGTGPDDVIGAILLEKLIALQCQKTKVGLNLHTQARDAFSYGFGVVTPIWKTEYGKKSVEEKVGGLFGFGGTTRTLEEDVLLFEGNALENIDPYLYLPDPTVPIHDPQAGEYIGWVNKTNYMTLLSDEQHDPDMFNVRYLKKLGNLRSMIYPSDSSGRGKKSGVWDDSTQTTESTCNMTRVKMFVRLIPEDWGLSKRDIPELWYFEVGQDEIVLKAKPANLDHNLFPVGVITPDYDGYSLAPISRIEMLSGMQGVLDFMFNSHVANVRKAINDMIIYDPYLVNSNDLRNPEAGKLIRLRRPAWGKGVKDVAQQLQIADVTRNNVGDSSFIVQWMDRISGADSSMQGALRSGGPERLTGAEFQGTRAGGISRLERISRVVGMQGMQDIGTFFAIHNRQMMNNPAFVKLSGDWQEVLLAEYGKQGINRGRITVNPQDVNVNYQVIVRDGSIPGGNYADVWVQLFQILGQNPELAQRFDVVRIFTHIARNLGAKNVNDFIRKDGGKQVQMQTQPNEAVQQQAQAGNLVPISAGGIGGE